jgi:hypothetical protein
MASGNPDGTNENHCSGVRRDRFIASTHAPYSGAERPPNPANHFIDGK